MNIFSVPKGRETVTGLITNIKRMAIHDGEGLRTTVFFKGCPLRCLWCHNPDTLSFEQEIGFYDHKCIRCGSCTQTCTGGALEAGEFRAEKCVRCFRCVESCPVGARELYGTLWDSEVLAAKVLEDRAFFENSGGGVTLSGGECLCQPEFAEELARIFWQEGLSVDIDTCGYVKFDVFKRLIPYTDEFLYDLKAIDPEVHKRCTGRDNGLILENLRKLDELGCRVEIRYPYVPGYNDGECEKIGAFLAERKHIKRIKVLGYHGYAKVKYEALGKENTLPDVTVTREDVREAVRKLSAFGLEAINGMDGD